MAEVGCVAEGPLLVPPKANGDELPASAGFESLPKAKVPPAVEPAPKLKPEAPEPVDPVFAPKLKDAGAELLVAALLPNVKEPGADAVPLEAPAFDANGLFVLPAVKLNVELGGSKGPRRWLRHRLLGCRPAKGEGGRGVLGSATERESSKGLATLWWC